MKVIKEGNLPGFKKRTLRGTCSNCGCIVEEDYEFLATIVIPTVACPTSGCNRPIYMLQKHPENLE